MENANINIRCQNFTELQTALINCINKFTERAINDF